MLVMDMESTQRPVPLAVAAGSVISRPPAGPAGRVSGQPHNECSARRSPTAAATRPGTPNPRERRNGWNDWPMRCRHSTCSSSAFMDHSQSSNEERGRGDRSVGESRQDEETTHALRHDDFGIDTTRDSAESVAALLAASSAARCPVGGLIGSSIGSPVGSPVRSSMAVR